MLRGQLGPVRAGERRARIGVQRQVEGRRAQRIGQPQPGAGREIQGPEQVQSRAVGGVPGHLELRAHRCKAHLAPRLVDGGAHTRAHQLPCLLEQLGGDGAVGLAGPHRLAGAERLQVGQPRGGPGELARGARIEPRRDGRVARGAQPADQRGVENGLRPPELQTIDVERVGHAGGDRQSELVEVERLPGVGRVAGDGGEQRGAALSHPLLGGADPEPGDGGIHPLALAELDGIEQGQRALRYGRLLGGRRGRRHPGGEQEHERGEQAVHAVRLRCGPRGGRSPRRARCR